MRFLTSIKGIDVDGKPLDHAYIHENATLLTCLRYMRIQRLGFAYDT